MGSHSESGSRFAAFSMFWFGPQMRLCGTSTPACHGDQALGTARVAHALVVLTQTGEVTPLVLHVFLKGKLRQHPPAAPAQQRRDLNSGTGPSLRVV